MKSLTHTQTVSRGIPQSHDGNLYGKSPKTPRIRINCSSSLSELRNNWFHGVSWRENEGEEEKGRGAGTENANAEMVVVAVDGGRRWLTVVVYAATNIYLSTQREARTTIPFHPFAANDMHIQANV